MGKIEETEYWVPEHVRAYCAGLGSCFRWRPWRAILSCQRPKNLEVLQPRRMQSPCIHAYQPASYLPDLLRFPMREIGPRVPESPCPRIHDAAKRTRAPRSHALLRPKCVKSGPACPNPAVLVAATPRNGPVPPDLTHSTAFDA